MANRYANLVGTKKISEDFNNINIGFDRVQADMDTNKGVAEAHINNTGIHVTPSQKAEWDAKAPGSTLDELHDHMADQAVHVTQADHDKLDSIEDGAEVNQPAFAKVNDIEAADPSDAVTIKGGIGITVTTNPNSNEVEITATGDAAPGAHGPTHTEYGADPIPAATVDEGGIMSAEQVAELITHGELLEEQAQAITELEDRLDTADTADLTLQPGLQVVNAAKDARFNLVRIAGKTEINYDGRIGLIGVENLYAIRYGENLLPPFYKWVVSAGATSTDAVIDPYLLQKTVPSAAQPTEIVVPVLGGQHLTLSYESSDSVAAYINIQWLDRDRSPISWTDQNEGGQTVLSPDIARFARVTATTLSAGTFTFKNPMLTLGSEPKPFKPREDSMLAFQTELHANPDDGSDPDVLFEREGQYFKLAKWKKVTIDGSIKWGASPASFYGFKVIGTLPDQFPRWKLYSEKATKYDGLILKTATSGGSWATNGADTTETSIDGSFYISISNADSGWGDDYTPMQDEIRAYFMGYQMGYLNGSAFAAPYNGTGTKVWRAIVGDTGSGSSTLPTSPSSVAIAAGWVPYQLVYQLASPTVEPVVSEGCLTLNEGENQVEVGTGIVLREGVKPYQNPSNGNTVINSTAPGQESSRVKFPVDKFLAVYRSSLPDNSVWSHQQGDPYAYGKDRLFMVGGAHYDPFAAYSVTYLKLDKSPIQPFTGILAANEKAQISDLTAGVAEALQRVSVVEQKKAEKDTPAVLITPTLLNGWRQYPHYQTVGYRKDSAGVVHLTGLVQGGAIVSNIFRLLEGFRPKSPLIFPVCASSGTNRVDVLADGHVYFNWAGTWDSEDWISLDGISFLAEQ